MALMGFLPLLSDDRIDQRVRNFFVLGLVLLAVAGCGDQQFRTPSSLSMPGFSGDVHGGQQPIAGSTIQLYATGNTGDGSASTPLIAIPTTTNAKGQFNVGAYTCPSASTNVYLTATGGNPGFQSAGTNPQIAAMVALGPCGNLTASTYMSVSELSTVAAVYALAPFMQSYTAIGSGPLDAQLMADAFATAGELVNTGTGAVPGASVPSGQTEQAQKLRAIANFLSTCVNSLGGQAGDGSSCGSLFSLATPSNGTSPTDTVGATLNIANNPTSQVVPLFGLSPAIAPFAPTLVKAPADWRLSITSSTPSPVFTLAPGTYPAGISVTLSDSNGNAVIYYTTDGRKPTMSSNVYSGGIALSATGMIRAIAVAAGVSSLPVAGTYTIQAPSISLTPSSASLGPSQTQALIATISSASNTSVAWSLNPAIGTISASGLYTAPAAIPTARTVTVSVSSVADPLISASSILSLAPPVNVAINPTGVSLTSAQIQSFTATVMNSTNTAVTWSTSPALGSISVTGLYTAPQSIPTAQTVTVTATSVADSTKSASVIVALVPTSTYYLSATGNDANSGISNGLPWLTPNHPVNCGDVIIALPSTAYSAANFGSGKWGQVACPAGNSVAWVKCATFDACRISVTSGTLDGMRVSASYWGVQGWEVTNTSVSTSGGNCFSATPPNSTTSIHHIVFANDVANQCPLDGLASGNNGTAGVDYIAIVGSIAYRAGQTNTWCGSGISVYEPVASDSLPGTHIYVGGSLSYAATNPAGCWDGNGIIFDTFDGDQTPLPHTYIQQGVIDNNITLSNAGVGVRIEYNNAGTGANHAPIYARYNTMWGNSNGANQYGSPSCGELQLYKTLTTDVYLNLAATNQAGCYGDASNLAYAYSVDTVDNASGVNQNVGWSATGSYSQLINSAGFSFGPQNAFGVNPTFAHATTPGAPNCGTATSAPNCMATVIANFMPTVAAAVGYGYQIPGAAPTYDPLFPQWLCNVNLPSGLVTMGCLAH